MKIYSSLSKKEEEFKPISEKVVGMYVCGPTVNGPAHLGHASTYIAFDIIRRAFIYMGYNVEYVVNLTDVHDDVIKVANKEGITIFELADRNIAQFMDDLKSLNIMLANVFPRVTEHIPEIISMIKLLVDKGFAYETEDGVYFNVSKFPMYGKLSGVKVEEGKTGQRIDTDKYEKESVADFALWKKWREGEPYWESPWGKGRPGWHIECSVMSKKYLGQPFDIHGGGMDLKFPHHENEIAQSEAAFDEKFVNYWMHAGLLNVNGEKMSKSAGNYIEIPDLLKKFEPMVLRYWRATVHYRSKINFSEELMESAKVALDKLRGLIQTWVSETAGKKGKVDKDAQKSFIEALQDDFNTPKAVAVLWDVARSEKLSSADKLATILDFDKVLGLKLDEIKTVEQRITDELKKKIEQLVQERDSARANKDWKKADELRKAIEDLGVEIIDTPEGTKWK